MLLALAAGTGARFRRSQEVERGGKICHAKSLLFARGFPSKRKWCGLLTNTKRRDFKRKAFILKPEIRLKEA